ncbi:TMEM43 family protein [Magnetospirillum gryphiswaldense]|uniref:Protein containing DUF1625 n=1 Tax=Magnetospirillum gryphiswaldense TaxID=55518 RepID=A4TYG1_9PROT|nr:TMEM43 family protein [Magnetospirillum gryphiswaldense]AVM75094.1 hypothetical protein MSR1_26140 [Magnetospirillum gryphiswaldense MSR-1]AVM78997.1 hypothetical protein MSR1L_26140 [Magnetospirillum gryphiswaldense]CAM75668.1 protein containing DUF1625 [Magnetospirillum gryphiswaldense MSR-1]
MNDDSDTYVEVTHGTWGDRIWESLKGIVIGLVLIPVSIALLSWNEEQAVDRSGALAIATDVVISVPAERVSAANEGKLVHVSGRVSTDDVLADPDFGVEVSAIKLVRSVETYQWLETSSSETRDKFGGGTETVTTYKYSKDWSSGLANSSSFKKPEGHQNPSDTPFQDIHLLAGKVTLGAFELNEAMIEAMDDLQPVPLRQMAAELPDELDGRRALFTGSEIYLGDSPDAPRIGDMRVKFTMVAPADVSVLSRQRGVSFVPYSTPTGDVQLVEYGLKSPEAMVRTAERESAVLTWALRLAGFVLMFMGFKLVFAIIEAIAAFLPPLAWLTGAVLSVAAGILAFVLSTIVIGTAWMAQRPLVATGFVVALIGASVTIWYRRRNKKPPQ